MDAFVHSFQAQAQHAFYFDIFDILLVYFKKIFFLIDPIYIVPDELETRLKFILFSLLFTPEPRDSMNSRPPDRTNSQPYIKQA